MSILLDRIVDEWSVIARREVERGLTVAHCILGTRTLLEVLHQLGVAADAVPVEALVANQLAAGLLGQGIPYQEWPPEAWSVGASIDVSGTGYPGHLVLVADVEEGRYLIDSSTRQFFRPQYGIMTPWAMHVGIDEAWPRDGVGMRYQAGTWEISWRPCPALGNRHRTASDWKRGRTTYVPELLDRVSQHVRQ